MRGRADRVLNDVNVPGASHRPCPLAFISFKNHLGAALMALAMAVLIICDPVDVHSSALAWALKQHGAEPILWHPAPPWAPAGSIRFNSASVDYRFAGTGGEITPASIDAVWMRRWPKPVFPAGFGESDQRASRAELQAYHGGVLELLPRDILWANPLDARRSANYKPRQLAAAVAVGLAIPETIVTDDAAQAKAFAASRPGEVIYKPFYSFFWERADKEIFQSVTTPVTAADFDDPQALIWSPGIFQAFVAKAYELRVSVFGRTCVSAKIFDQDPIDWRTRQSDMKIAPYRLPDAIERKVHALMDALGLVMGMVDFIVTPAGDYVFLEVNEQGQFLWVEEACPELPLLDIAARFLASGEPRFEAGPSRGAGPRYDVFVAEESETYLEGKQAFVAAGGILDHALLKDRQGG